MKLSFVVGETLSVGVILGFVGLLFVQMVTA